jgi:hypothetical protein
MPNSMSFGMLDDFLKNSDVLLDVIVVVKRTQRHLNEDTVFSTNLY